MRLFTGMACFSPSVPSCIQKTWARYGGVVSDTPKERHISQWFFCVDIEDPWLARFAFSMQPIVVFHVNWILDTVTSGFALPLTDYVLEVAEKDDDAAGRNEIVRGCLGSRPTGDGREAPEIDAEISSPAKTYSMSTRLSSGRKRSPEPSPDHRVDKRARSHITPIQCSTTALGTLVLENTSASRGQAYISPGSDSALAASSFLFKTAAENNSGFRRFPSFSVTFNSIQTHKLAREQSDNHIIDLESINSSVTKTDHDRPSSCENLDKKRQVRYKVESLQSNPGLPSQLSSKLIDSELNPELGFAGYIPLLSKSRFGTQGIWETLIQDSSHSTESVTADVNNKSPTIRVPDALNALKKVNANRNPDGNVLATLFVKGRMHCGRKFGVDKGDRRKTI